MNTFLKMGMAHFIIMDSAKTSTGVVTKNIHGRLVSMAKLMTIENMSISGLLIAVRINIINAICTLVTSVVRRVTSDDDENLSMFLNE